MTDTKGMTEPMPVPKLCLNMIVRNEAAIIERCLASVADHVACWVIVDTGSTDGTQEMIREFFAARGIPGELHSAPFVNFSQARNEALDRAHASPLVFDYLLLTDADMEFWVHDLDFAASLTENAYVLLQRSMATYWNVRIVRRGIGARYVGVTHEYVDVPGGGIRAFDQAWFIDHASGSNRENKYDRDIRLLREDLEADPENVRSLFYLAQCYCGSGRYHEAVEAYDRRIDQGGWPEEIWFSRLQKARCILNTGDGQGFVREALTAFAERPHRVETLYDLARYYRAIGHHDEALACSEAGLSLHYPPGNDTLFIEDWIYDFGIRQEFAHAAARAEDAGARERGHRMCEWLALSRHGRDAAQDAAQETGAGYAVAAGSILPSLVVSQLHTPPAIVPGAPSVVSVGDAVFVALPTRGAEGAGGMLLQLDGELGVQAAHRIAGPDADGPHPGLDELRLVAWRGDLWTLSAGREPGPDGLPPLVLSRLSVEDGALRAVDPTILPAGLRDRSTLMPMVQGDRLRLCVGIDPSRVLDVESGDVATTDSPAALRRSSGVTQLIPFDGGWLGLAREASADGARVTHRFLQFDGDHVLRRLSRRVHLVEPAGECLAGLAAHPDGQRLILSFGVSGAAGDTAWLGLVGADDVRAAMEDVAEIAASVRVAWPQAKPVSQGGAPGPLSAQAASEAAAVRSFDLFDTLVARRCVQPMGVFLQVEAETGHAGFTRVRMSTEREICAGQYTLDLIYERMVERYGVTQAEADRLKAAEIAAEHRNLFPIAEHCAEVGRNDIVVSDMYLPAEVLRTVIDDTCNLPGRRLVLSSNGKHFGHIWPVIQASVRIREHLGDNPHADVATPRQAGIPARLTRVTDRYEVETQLHEAGYEPLANLVREARLTSWLADPALRRAQLAQVEINFPLLFLTTLHLLRASRREDWDHILFSGRDCYLWTFLYDGLRPILPGMPSATYFHTGRAVRLSPSADYLDYFHQLRAGRRNVVVDLCGLGVSLRSLIAQAPAAHTDIYLLHELLIPEMKRTYEASARRMAGSWDGASDRALHSVIARAPRGGDNDVLEELNRAPHPGVQDVRVTEHGFEPVFGSIGYKGEAERMLRVHQAAFRRCCDLLPTLSRSAVEAMLERDPAPMIARIYDRLPGLLPDLHAFIHHKVQEERALTEAMTRAAAACEPEAVGD